MRIHQRLSMLFALLLHLVPIVLGWMQWQDFRIASAASHSQFVIQVQLSESVTAPAVTAFTKPQATGPGDADKLSTVASVPAVIISSSFPSAYLDPAELDVRSEPLEPVMLAFPDGVKESSGLVSAVLVLYIDHTGQIEHIEVTDSTLPLIFEQAALTAFMQARMRPGEKNGSAVRSKMRILVEFES